MVTGLVLHTQSEIESVFIAALRNGNFGSISPIERYFHCGAIEIWAAIRLETCMLHIMYSLWRDAK
jgi:hypothetical protein